MQKPLQLLNNPITDMKVMPVIKSLPLHKSPGTDSFSSEYYKAFAETIVPNLTELFNKALTLGSFPSAMLQLS